MQSDETLMKRILQGDAEAFEVLLARYEETVRRHLIRMVRDKSAADDILQEVFLRVWTRAEQWHGGGAVRAWLFRIATNQALNHLRSLRRRRQTRLQPPTRDAGDEDENPAPSWMIDAAALGPDAILELAERQERFRQLVDGLSEEKREVLRMVHEVDMNVKDVAEALGVPEGTVKSRLHYAIRDLARKWQDLKRRREDSE